jgi:hypothetical protein
LNFDDSYRGEERFSLASLVLLVIFVAAAGLIVAAVIWRPWFGDDSAPAITQPTAQAQQEVVAADATPAPADPNAPQGP